MTPLSAMGGAGDSSGLAFLVMFAGRNRLAAARARQLAGRLEILEDARPARQQHMVFEQQRDDGIDFLRRDDAEPHIWHGQRRPPARQSGH